jgi:hypothetical protein
MDYPLRLSFKKIAIAQQISVTDPSGLLVWYVRQKAFKLKESVTVFGDREETRALYEMRADRVIDFSARYIITDAGTGMELGVVQRQGMRSFWRTRYEVRGANGARFELQEVNPWTQVADAFLGEVPILGMLTGYVLQARYVMAPPNGNPVFNLVKRPAFFEGRFDIERVTPLAEADETLALLSLLMIVLLERESG